MADDLSLLLRIRGDSAGATKATADTRAAIQQLRNSATTDLKSVQAASTASLSSVTSSLSQITSSIPVVGRAFSGLSSTLGTVGEAGTAAGTGIASMAGPIGLVVVAIGAAVTASIALHKWLFDLATAAAEFRGKLVDLSQQTGVSVETLSALEIVAKTTGGSIEQISASLGIFQRHLEDAQDPTTKQAKLFADLGVATENTEQALRDTLTALAAMPTGFRQTAAALELFGRGGKSILAILKETNGDLDGAIERFRELGIIVSEEDAKAADEFNDQLALLQFQFRGLLGKEVIPAALDALKDLSQFLKDNKRDIDAVAQAAGTLATVLGTTLKITLAETGGLIRAANEPYVKFAETLERIVNALKYLSGNIPTQSLLNPEGGARGISLQPQNVGGGETDTRIHQPITEGEIERATQLKKAQDNLRDALKRQVDAWKLLVAEMSLAAAAYQGIDTTTREYTVQQQIANGVFGDANSLLAQNALAAAKATDEFIKKRKAIDELTQFQESLTEAVDRAINGEKSLFTITEDVIKKYEESGELLSLTEEHWLRYKTAVVAVTEALKMYKETLAAILLPGEGGEGLGEDAIAKAAGAAADAAAGTPPPLPDAAEFDARATAINAGLDAMREGFAGLADAVSSAIDSFIKFGTAGTSFRQFVTEILSGIARMAAVKAIFHLAEGFAALAMAFFGIPNAGPSAAAHFKAAAIYGAIAGIAAVAGRATAGGAFTQDVGGGGGTGGSGGSGGRTTSGRPDRPQTVEVDRNRFQPIARELVFRVKGDAVVDSFIEDFDLNGRTRIKILSEG